MGNVNFMCFDAEAGKAGKVVATASIQGRPADVADFLAIWMKNRQDGISLARQLGLEFHAPEGEES